MYNRYTKSEQCRHKYVLYSNYNKKNDSYVVTLGCIGEVEGREGLNERPCLTCTKKTIIFLKVQNLDQYMYTDMIM